MVSSYRAMEALRVVLGEARAPALEDARRAMERARATAEDYAQGGARIAPDGLTWRAWEARLLRGVYEAYDLIGDIADAIEGVSRGAHDPEAAVAMIDELLASLVISHMRARAPAPDESDDEPAAAAALALDQVQVALEPALDEGALDQGAPTPSLR